MNDRSKALADRMARLHKQLRNIAASRYVHIGFGGEHKPTAKAMILAAAILLEEAEKLQRTIG